LLEALPSPWAPPAQDRSRTNALENLPPVSILTEMDPRPRDDMDAAKDLADLVAQSASPFNEAIAYLQRDQKYDTLRHRLENAHAAVEARRRVRLNEGRDR
jgi:hypothetical protein